MDWIYFVVLGILITGLIILLLCVKRALDREGTPVHFSCPMESSGRFFAVIYQIEERDPNLSDEDPPHRSWPSMEVVGAKNPEDAALAARLWLEQNGIKTNTVGWRMRYSAFSAREICPSCKREAKM